MYRYDRVPHKWTRVGGDVGEPDEVYYGGEYGLFRITPNPDKPGSTYIVRWRRRKHNYATHAWHPIGGPGAEFVVTADTVFGLTPDRGAVYRYDDVGSSWTAVGGPAAHLYGGGYGLIATSPDNASVWRFLWEPNTWTQIGGPGAEFAVTADTVFGLTPDRGAVYRYDGRERSWTAVGGPASTICAFFEED